MPDSQHHPNSIPAKYDPNRGSDGKFRPGNKASNGWNSPLAKRFNEVQMAWLDMITPEAMAAVQNELLWLTQQRENLDVKIKAVVYWQDRVMGKTKERIEVDVAKTGNTPVVELSEAELVFLEGIVQRREEQK